MRGKARFAGWGRAEAAEAAEAAVGSAASALDSVNTDRSAAAVVLANEFMSEEFPCGYRRSPGNSTQAPLPKAQAMVADALVWTDRV